MTTIMTNPAMSAATDSGGEFLGWDRPPVALVIDADEDTRKTCAEILDRQGWRVHLSVSATDGLDRCEIVNPDFIILDGALCGPDNRNVIDQLRTRPATELIPIVMFSENDQSETIKRGLAAGADTVLAKPLDSEEFDLRVKSLSRLHRIWRELQDERSVLGEQTRILSLLLDLSALLARTEKLDTILAKTISTASEMTFCRRISVMLPNADRTELFIAAGLGIDERVRKNVRLGIGESIAGRVFMTGETIVLNCQQDAAKYLDERDLRVFSGLPMMCTPLCASERVIGVLNLTDRFHERPFSSNELGFMNLLTNCTASAIQNVRTRKARDEARDSIVIALAKLAEHRDDDTGKHLDRVTIFSMKLAEALRKTPRYASEIDDDFMWNLQRAAPLHDIGKVAIPDAILLKPGRLTDTEMNVMRTHANVGAETIRSLLDRAPDSGFLKMAEQISASHHEWFDGTGYPNGLSGQDIPLAARILALADVYDALRTERVYKRGMSHRKAVEIIEKETGTHFDPDVVDAFMKLEATFERLARELSDPNIDPRR
ncbi:MAG: HD domain-containing protein [Phycisphaerales bacterium]|nr:HD domain-containing protein [Phycisphaerales bacterium]MCB9857270.1 HD domain-containing protein [Phycisphaerales bacterium]MCB9863016.1 HD domain-containing protein [Phycisphaerales bacterium]